MSQTTKFTSLHGIEYEIKEIYGDFEETLTARGTKNKSDGRRMLNAVTKLVEAVRWKGDTWKRGESITPEFIQKIPSGDVLQILAHARMMVDFTINEEGMKVESEKATVNIGNPKDKNTYFADVVLEDCVVEETPEIWDSKQKKYVPLKFKDLESFTKNKTLIVDFPAKKGHYKFTLASAKNDVAFSESSNPSTLSYLTARNIAFRPYTDKENENGFIPLTVADLKKLPRWDLKFIQNRILKAEGSYDLIYTDEDGNAHSIIGNSDFLS